MRRTAATKRNRIVTSSLLTANPLPRGDSVHNRKISATKNRATRWELATLFANMLHEDHFASPQGDCGFNDPVAMCGLHRAPSSPDSAEIDMASTSGLSHFWLPLQLPNERRAEQNGRNQMLKISLFAVATTLMLAVAGFPELTLAGS
jgi:hypothetical protein